MSVRTQSNSVCEAEGKPTSICLKPMRTSILNISIFSSTFIGSTSAWLPSRRSTEHQMGAFSSRREGHWRSGSVIGGQGTYFFMARVSPRCSSKKASAPVGAKACFAVPPNFTARGGDLSAR